MARRAAAPQDKTCFVGGGARWKVAAALAVGLFIVVRVVVPSSAATSPTAAAMDQVLRPIGTMVAVLFGCLAVFLHIKHVRRKGTQAGRSVLAPPAAPVITDPDAVATAWTELTRAKPGAPAAPETWSLDLLRQIEWKRVEELTAAYFREKTFRTETIAAGADGGIDVKLFVQGKAEPFAVVQCKAWNTRNVGVSNIRELLGVMAHQKVPKGMFVTTGAYTPDAIAFAKTSPITLITGEMLFKGICALPTEAQSRLLLVATEGEYLTPTCPSCGIKMVHRSGKKGEFWGCQNFPRCSQTFNTR